MLVSNIIALSPNYSWFIFLFRFGTAGQEIVSKGIIIPAILRAFSRFIYFYFYFSNYRRIRGFNKGGGNKIFRYISDNKTNDKILNEKIGLEEMNTDVPDLMMESMNLAMMGMERQHLAVDALWELAFNLTGNSLSFSYPH